MAGQSKAATEAKKQRVIDAINSTLAEGGQVSIRGVAKAAGVDHVFIQRREDLRSIILAHERLMNDDDVYRARGTATLTGPQRDFVDRARGAEPFAQYARRALLEKAARDLGCDIDDVEALDTARRPARRRQNWSERQQREEQGR